MHIVVQDDDPDHHPQAERHRLLAGEPAAVLSERTGVEVTHVMWAQEPHIANGRTSLTAFPA